MILPSILLVFASACTPNGEDRPESTSCEAGFILDGSACVPESCGTGRWGNLPIDGDTVYVDISATADGDGTEAAPHATIQEGLDRAGALEGRQVAVAAGTYPETLELTTDHADVHLAGRCRELVILDASVRLDETPGMMIDAGYTAVEVSGVTVADSPYIGLRVESGDVLFHDAVISGSAFMATMVVHAGIGETTDLVMEGCLIEGNGGAGVTAYHKDTHVTLGNTTIRNTQPDANGDFGRGIEVYEGATLSAEGCLIEGNTQLGLFATNSDTTVTIEDTIVRDTPFGRGIDVSDGATLTAEGCLMEANTEFGVYATDPDTHVTLRETTIRASQPTESGVLGVGVLVQEGAALSLEGCLVEGNTATGVSVINPDTHVTLHETTVRDTRPDANGEFGRGIDVQDRATLSAHDCLIEANADDGVWVSDPGTQVTLRNTTVKDTLPDANGEFGRGIQVNLGATLTLEACLIEGNTEIGLHAGGPGTRVSVRGTTVRNTHPGKNRLSGLGIEASEGATLSAEGCLVEENTGAGIAVLDQDTEVTLRDTTVRNTQPATSGESGSRGRGIEVNAGASLIAENCLIDGNPELGLFATNPDTQVTLRGTTVRNTHPDAEGAWGRGVEVNDGATLAAEDCLIDGNTSEGMTASNHGTRVTLRSSTISGTHCGADVWGSSAIGLNVQEGATMSVSRLAVLSNDGPGILVNGEGAVLDCSECLIADNAFAGAAALRDGTLTITDSTIEGTRSSTDLLGGAGVYAWSWIGGPPTIILTDTLIQDNAIAGVWLIGNGVYVLRGNTISGGVGEPFGSGSRCGDAVLARDGVMAWNEKTGLLLEDNVFQDASGSGVFLDNASALLSGNSYADNALDLVVQNQSCGSLPTGYSEAPLRDLCPDFAYPTCYAEFFFVALPAEPVEEGAAFR